MIKKIAEEELKFYNWKRFKSLTGIYINAGRI